MSLLIVFPTKARPQKFFQVFRRYHDFLRDDDTRFLVTIDLSDPTMYNKNVVEALKQFGNTTVQFSDKPGKINACNFGVAENVRDGEIILLASDDMIVKQAGFDSRILDDFAKWFPEGDGVIPYYDGPTPLNKLCCLDKKYFDRFGYLYHPSYRSLFCDNEFMEVAYLLNRQVFIKETIIQHEHYSNGHGRPDRLMIHNERFYDEDQLNYNNRKQLNFNLNEQ